MLRNLAVIVGLSFSLNAFADSPIEGQRESQRATEKKAYGEARVELTLDGEREYQGVKKMYKLVCDCFAGIKWAEKKVNGKKCDLGKKYLYGVKGCTLYKKTRNPGQDWAALDWNEIDSLDPMDLENMIYQTATPQTIAIGNLMPAIQGTDLNIEFDPALWPGELSCSLVKKQSFATGSTILDANATSPILDEINLVPDYSTCYPQGN